MSSSETTAPRQHAFTGPALPQLREPSHAERVRTVRSRNESTTNTSWNKDGSIKRALSLAYSYKSALCLSAGGGASARRVSTSTTVSSSYSGL
jgi:hypothetical protein